jgi:hypothetical protein
LLLLLLPPLRPLLLLLLLLPLSSVQPPIQTPPLRSLAVWKTFLWVVKW